MSTYTPLLGLTLPADNSLTGTWGAVVNDYITTYLDAAVAGAQVISGSQTAVTLSINNGTALTQAGPSGSTGSALYSIIRCSGNPVSMLTVTAPASSKVYLVLNQTSTNQLVKIVGAGPTTGVTISAGQAALVAWNGTDFSLIATTDISKLSGTVAVANGGTGQTTYTDGQLLIGNSTGNTLTKATLTAGSGISITNGSGAITIATSGVGTVTSVGMTVPTFLSVSPPTITTSGTFAVTLSGTALPVANGGTGATTLTGVVIGNGTSAFTVKTNPTGAFVGTTDSQTLSSKRIDPRTSSAATATTLTPDVSAVDQYNLTALASGLTINAPTGTPVDGNKLIFRILDNGTSRALTWNATYTAIGVTLPTSTTASKTTYVGCIYNANNTRWDVVAVTTQA